MAEREAGTEGDGIRRLLFVCTGNTCRSPMAEALARREAASRGMDVEIRSAGIGAAAGSGTSSGAFLAGRERNLDLSDHVATPLTGELVEWADRVVCMTAAHRDAVTGLGADESRVGLLTEYLPRDHPRAGGNVPDPVGRPLEVYRETLDLLEAAVARMMGDIAERTGD